MRRQKSLLILKTESHDSGVLVVGVVTLKTVKPVRAPPQSNLMIRI